MSDIINHATINHSVAYADGLTHTNTIEGFRALVKRAWYGRHHRSTGAIYLHCDPTASHYIKIMMDGIFGHQNFRSEIIWKRTSAHSSAKRHGPVHDVILFYSMGDHFTWNQQYQPYDPAYLDVFLIRLMRAGGAGNAPT